jgi:sugar lactone lactonase YvrE
MSERILPNVALCVSLAFAVATLAGPASAESPKVISDKTVTGFKFPESVAYDPNADALYVSEFGSELKPTEKDGQGRIAKVALDGTVKEERFLPAEGQTLDKPKGIWVEGNRLWVTDIDSLWVFDTGTKEGKKVALPESQFANDPTIIGDAVYVSDNRGDQLYRVEPADFLDMEGDPEVTRVFSGAGINPNGVYPTADGALLMVGFQSAEEPRGIYKMEPGGEPTALAEGLGRLDGVYQMEDGTLLVTDWDAGALGAWDESMGFQALATGFKGPADFAVVPNAEGLLVVVPDLVQSELRLIQLGQ